MAPRNGGTKGEGGYFWSRDEWRMVVVKDGEALPGAKDERFMKIPTTAMLLLAPVMGGLFVVFLPFVGFALVAHQLGKQTLATVRRRALHVPAKAPVARPAAAAKPAHEAVRKAS
jgi:hypothetical protein